MTKETIDRLRKKPRTICTKCHSKQRYTNPMSRCFECKKKFCFDHIIAGQIRHGMDENEPVRDVCEACHLQFKYFDVSKYNYALR